LILGILINQVMLEGCPQSFETVYLSHK